MNIGTLIIIVGAVILALKVAPVAAFGDTHVGAPDLSKEVWVPLLAVGWFSLVWMFRNA